MKTLLKKRIHPVLGYAFLFGAGIISLNQTMATVEPSVQHLVPATTAPQTAIFPSAPEPADLPTLKIAAQEFSAQLATVKNQAGQLEKLGRTPPQELYDAIGQGEQLVAIINQASSLDDLKGMNAGHQMLTIARAISDNSKF
jgi:hypothetical protein